MAQNKPQSGQGAPMYGQGQAPFYGQNPYMYYYPQQGQGGMQPPQVQPGTYSGSINPPNMLPSEESYIENILRLNAGKEATVYMTFENNDQWNAKVFKGIIEAAGRDHIILSDPQTGKRYLLLTIYLDYITFDEEINYNLPFGGSSAGFAQYNPR
ncbi:spore coat protein GerQ [Halobacillus sp. ACCC02827]|uniref:spore coat protein GerQ n=1 Tax=Bacillaceae TaxID=186817 RepID=UPI0002A4EFA9|nr:MULTISPECIES: spore coat protein GerQ [Bacillaceae]ELK48994.1 spore coat protein GerQ [Halobacillus sp. BAB-2008]QHT48212.1 spore coat protein GerQ [Bacillus sp. SB49]WJE15445.1 spore coat protein GerQ [Halobacillus sp. ACCC02827]